ncbi:hypothetical protein KO317_02890 [Candidatus Micrarchaeota archaeon]|nr:hypothetical protein [Candidatus Micrarchaeota archaeon]
MVKEFWSDNITKQSWERLTQLINEFDFVLIGGWSLFLYTRINKSKDIDILIDMDTLYSIKNNYDLKKNVNLKKYELEDQGFDIDIYVPYFSELPIPVEDILKMKNPRIQGIKTVQPEVLLILKQCAYIDRKDSIKGKKDAIDIITLLKYSGIGFKKYKQLLKEYKLNDYFEYLIKLINTFDDHTYTGMDFMEFKKWKKEILKTLKQ